MATKKAGVKATYISILFDHELKNEMAAAAKKRGMEMSQLARVILVNYLKPGTFSL